MRNNTQLMKSVIRNKQQTPAAGPEERASQAISHTSRCLFIFTCVFPEKRMPSPTHSGCGSPGESATAPVSVTRNTEPANTPVTATALRCEGGTVPQFVPPACTGAGCAVPTLNGAWHSSAALHLNTDEDEFIPAFSIYFRAGKREISCYPRLSSGHKAVLDDRRSLAPAAHCGLCLWEMLYLFFFFPLGYIQSKHNIDNQLFFLRFPVLIRGTCRGKKHCNEILARVALVTAQMKPSYIHWSPPSVTNTSWAVVTPVWTSWMHDQVSRANTLKPHLYSYGLIWLFVVWPSATEICGASLCSSSLSSHSSR